MLLKAVNYFKKGSILAVEYASDIFYHLMRTRVNIYGFITLIQIPIHLP